MRPAQQNRRMRGRGNNNNNNNNNRKGPNPLTRNYESNGPDVKIRGNAQHIAEKYVALARDAQVSGDRVIAENYLQHAEHYTRIILAAQAHFNTQQIQREEQFEEDGEESSSAVQQSNTDQPHDSANEPQPVIEGTPAEVVFSEDGHSSTEQPRNHNNRDPRRNNMRLRRPRFDAQAHAMQAAVNNDPARAEQPQPEISQRSVENQQPDIVQVGTEQPQEAQPDRRPVAEVAAKEPIFTTTVDATEDAAAEKPVRPRTRAVRAKPVEDENAEAPIRRRPGRPRRVKAPEDEVAQDVKEVGDA